MMEDTSFENLLFPLADISTISLDYDGGTKILTGTRSISIKFHPVGQMHFKLDVVSSFISMGAEQSAILIHVGGYLYLTICYNKQGDTASAWLVNSKALGLKRIDMVGLFDKQLSIRTISLQLKDGIVGSWSRKMKSNKWRKIKLP